MQAMDSRDLEDLFCRYRRSVLRRANAILGDRDAAKDTVQEVFMRAMNSRVEIGRLESPMRWLYRVTTNLCLNRLRDVARQKRILGASGPAPPSDHGQADAAITVRALLRNVSPALQEIAVYYFVDHMSQDEISEMLGIPRRTVGHRLEQFRAAALSSTTLRERASS
jgi:RNA polymerase sigma-70 factor (ECF subfamily)